MAGKRVLIVDDNEDFRFLIRSHLEKGGYQVVGEARNGAEAVSMSFKLNPDFMTLDHQMPHLTGKQALEHIQEIRPETTVIVVSATLEDPPEWAEHFLPKSEISRLPEFMDRLGS